MKYCVSKELFIAVNGCENKERLSLINKNNMVEINYFFFACKEWASNKGCHIYSHTNACHIHYNVASFKSFSEQQAVFDACQWILERENKK